MGILFTTHMGFLFTITLGILLTITMGFLFTIVLGIQFTISTCFPDLCTLQHELIKVDVRHKKYVYSIQSRISKGKHELKVVTRDNSRVFKPINTSLAIDPRKIGGSVEEIRRKYEHLRPEPLEITTWNFLNGLPSPVFIGLERSVEDHPSGRIVRRRPRYLGDPERTTPVERATILMRDAFNTGTRRLVEINDELNRKLLELSFSGVLRSTSNFRPRSSKDAARKIKQLKDQFVSSANKNAYSKAFSAKGVRNAFVRYLDELSSVLSDESKENRAWVILNQNNYDRTAKMLDLFKEHESRVQSVQLEITTFRKAVDRFIGDSGKSILFDADTGTPYFKAGTYSEHLSLSELSSGETQVVILLSYFAFHAKGGNPIVIDEPELSLHVQWQKYFVSAVKEVMPDKCQTIMATHSPEICGAEDVNVQSISVR